MKLRLLIPMVAVFVCFSTGLVRADAIRINGSTTVLPIAQKASEAFMKEHPDVAISVSGGGSGNGIKALIDGTTDIADSSRFIKEKEVATAVEKGRYPVPFAVAYDCIVPVVNPANPSTNLTLDQLRAIYMGKVKNWKDLGGPDSPIAVISRDTSSGTYEVWDEKVMNKERVFPGALLQASNGAVAQAVSKNKNAIGYLGIGYVNKDIKALSVNDIPGNEETTLNGSYPVARPLFMFTFGWPNGDVLKFINFVLDPNKGQKLVKEAGFVQLY